MAIPAPIPSDGQWTVRLDTPCDFFDVDSNELSVPFFLWDNSSIFLSSLEKKLGILSSDGNFESGSMVAIKNHEDLGLYYTSKKSKLPIISNL